MTNLEIFQAEHGRAWAEIVSTPAFLAALSIATAEKTQQLLNISDVDVATKAHIILADYRGHLRYEAALLGLHEKKATVFSDGPVEDYTVDPELEAHELHKAETQAEREDEDQLLAPVPLVSNVKKRVKKTSKKAKR